MYYFKYQERTVEKYNVVFGREKVKKLRIEIINNCSEIVHHEYDDKKGPDISDQLRIRNYSCKDIAVNDYHNFSLENGTLHHFSYDEYKFPYLVSLIDRLLAGDPSSITEIYNPDYEKDKIPINDDIKVALQELSKANKLSSWERLKKLQEIELLTEKSNLNADRQPIDAYYLKLQMLISLHLVAIISKEKIPSHPSFFAQPPISDENNNSSKTKKRILSRLKKIKDNKSP